MPTESLVGLTIVAVMSVALALYMDSHRAEDHRRQKKSNSAEK